MIIFDIFTTLKNKIKIGYICFFIILILFVFIGIASLILTCFLPTGQSSLPINNINKNNGRKNALIIGLSADPTNLTANMAADAPTAEITSKIYDGLVRYNRNFKIVPDLAKSWKISNGGKTITFYLRRNVYWQNGQKFTAKDVMFTYKLMINPKTPTPDAAEYLKVYKAKTIGNYIFQVTYKKSFAPAFSSWVLNILPEKLLKGKNLLTTKFRGHPIGTGPYEFDKWIHGYEIVLKANPHYFMGTPRIRWLIYKIVPDHATMFLMLKTNNINYMGLNPIQFEYETNSKKFKLHYKKYIYLQRTYTFLGYNLLYPLFKNVKVRQALSYAINKKEIIKGALLGLGVYCRGPFMPGTYFYNKNVKIYKYNPVKALSILNKQGWHLNKHGILEKRGIPFKFTILTSYRNPEWLSAAEIIQQNLKKIGIEVDIKLMESTSLISEIMKKRFQSVLFSFFMYSNPYYTVSMFIGSNIAPKGLNFTSFEDPKVNELYRKAYSTFNLKKQRKYYFKIQKLLANQAPYSFLYIPYSMTAVKSSVKGIKPAPAGIGYDIKNWYYINSY